MMSKWPNLQLLRRLKRKLRQHVEQRGVQRRHLVPVPLLLFLVVVVLMQQICLRICTMKVGHITYIFLRREADFIGL